MNNIRLNRKKNINVNSAICQLYYFWNKILFDKMMILPALYFAIFIYLLNLICISMTQ